MTRKYVKTFYKLDLYLKPEGLFTCSASIKLDRNDANVIQPAAFTITGTGGGAVFGSTESIFGTSLYTSPNDETYKNNLTRFRKDCCSTYRRQ